MECFSSLPCFSAMSSTSLDCSWGEVKSVGWVGWVLFSHWMLCGWDQKTKILKGINVNYQWVVVIVAVGCRIVVHIAIGGCLKLTRKTLKNCCSLILIWSPINWKMSRNPNDNIEWCSGLWPDVWKLIVFTINNIVFVTWV